ncbi:mCG1036175 [Mus musculus]|nr:mCG1036175 [Mus musculus]
MPGGVFTKLPAPPLLRTGFVCVALAVLELCRPGWPRTQRSACLCLPSTGMKGMCRILFTQSTNDQDFGEHSMFIPRK